MNKINIFLDMDGVLAEYNPDVLKLMNNKGYFADLPPQENLVRMAELLIQSGRYNVYILSSVIDSPYAIDEKSNWLDENLPSLPVKNRIFVPIEAIKGEYVQSQVNTKNSINVLIDDFSNNLHKWQLHNSVGIKVLNQLNNNNKSWVESGGSVIHYKSSPDTLLLEVEDIIQRYIDNIQE